MADDLECRATQFQTLLAPRELRSPQHCLSIFLLVGISMISVIEKKKLHVYDLKRKVDSDSSWIPGFGIWPVVLEYVQTDLLPAKRSVEVAWPVIVIIPDTATGRRRHDPANARDVS